MTNGKRWIPSRMSANFPSMGWKSSHAKYSVDGMRLFEKYLEEWSGVILDAKVLMDKDSKLDQLKGLTYSLKKIHELSHKREVPYYIFTGQPILHQVQPLRKSIMNTTTRKTMTKTS